MSGLSKHRLALSLTLTSAFFTGHLLSAQEATPAPVADASPVTATEAYEPAPQAYEAPQVYEPIVATETKSCNCCSTPCCTKNISQIIKAHNSKVMNTHTTLGGAAV